MRPLLLALLLPLLAGCLSSRPGLPAPEPHPLARPSDGLLEDERLQALVERQARRDGDALRAALAGPEAAVRARAALALASVQDTAAVGALHYLLEDRDPRVRADAAFALGQTAGEASSDAFLQALRAEPEPAVQRLLLEALGKTGGAPSLAALAHLDLPPTLDGARALAFARYGLRGLHEPAAVTWLANRLTAPEAATREAAAYYFGRMPGPSPSPGLAAALLAAADSLEAGDPAQMHLALALGRMQNEDALGRLLVLLRESPDWRVRANAARALGASRPGAEAALLAALDDPSEHVAVTAAAALAAADTLSPETLDAAEAWHEAHPQAWPVWTALMPALVKADRDARALSWMMTLNAGSAALPEAEQPFALAAALAALGASRHPEALPLLLEAAGDDDPRVAFAAVEALRQRWAEARAPEAAPTFYEAFARALSQGDRATAFAAAPALGDSLFRPLGASALLRDTYARMSVPEDIEPMAEIVRAVGEVRDTSAVPFLLEVALHGPHPTLRHAAARTLDERFGEGIDFEPTGINAPPFPRIDWPYLRRLGRHPLLTLETRHGRIVIEMDTEQAPLTVQRLARNAEARRYDGVPFHRVVPNFVAQGGDFERADGFGGPGYFLPSEFTRIPFAEGAAGMASAGKDTEGSQFFLTHAMQPHLDGRYTAFGRVVAGQEVVDALGQGDLVRRATLTRRP